MKNQLAAGAVLVAIAGVAAGQSIVFENLPDQANGGIADNSGLAPPNRSADDFSLATTELIGSIQFWGLWLNNVVGLENFTAVIYGNTNGSPGSVLANISLINTSSSTTGVSVFGFDEYIYSADLSTAFTAEAGVTYFLSIFNDSGLGSGGTWAWESSSAGNVGWLSDDFGTTFDEDDRIGGFAFRLINVPSPMSASLLGLGGILVARRRR